MSQAARPGRRVADLTDLTDLPEGEPHPVRVASFDELAEDPADGRAAPRVARFDDVADDDPRGADRRGADRRGADRRGEDRGTEPAARVASFDGLTPDEDTGPARVASFGPAADAAGAGAAADDTLPEEPAGAARVATFDRPAEVRTGRGRRGDRSGGGTTDGEASGGPGAEAGPRSRGGGGASPAPEDTGPEITGPESVGPQTGERAGHGRRSRGRGRTRERRGAAERPPETPEELTARAKEICLRLLADRARTVQELRDALTRKDVPAETADAVLERFDEVGLVDDAAFADQWVRSRHRFRGLGRRAIAAELRRKGVGAETAAEALTGIDDDAERERARELVVRRLRNLPVGTREERQSTSRKLVGMLARKGYGPGVAYGVVKDEIAAAGADPDEFDNPPPDD